MKHKIYIDEDILIWLHRVWKPNKNIKPSSNDFRRPKEEVGWIADERWGCGVGFRHIFWSSVTVQLSHSKLQYDMEFPLSNWRPNIYRDPFRCCLNIWTNFQVLSFSVLLQLMQLTYKPIELTQDLSYK